MAGDNRYNGAYYYSKEIVERIIPNIKTEKDWVTVNAGVCWDNAIVFIHNNKRPEVYNWLNRHDNLILVCGVESTMRRVAHLGTPIYLPLSVNVEEVKRYRREKTKKLAFIGRKSKRRNMFFPKGTEFIEGMPRESLLAEMAKYEQVYAVGRTAIEAKILNCEVLPYDPRFPDPRAWRILDNLDACKILQEKINEVDYNI